MFCAIYVLDVSLVFSQRFTGSAVGYTTSSLALWCCIMTAVVLFRLYASIRSLQVVISF